LISGVFLVYLLIHSLLENVTLTLLFLLLLFDTPTCQMQSRVAVREKIAFSLGYMD